MITGKLGVTEPGRGKVAPVGEIRIPIVAAAFRPAGTEADGLQETFLLEIILQVDARAVQRRRVAGLVIEQEPVVALGWIGEVGCAARASGRGPELDRRG